MTYSVDVPRGRGPIEFPEIKATAPEQKTLNIRSKNLQKESYLKRNLY